MFGSLGPTELIIALVIILLLFGAKKVPELARGLGSGVREFRAGTREDAVDRKEEEKKEEELTSAEAKTGAEAGAGARDERLDDEVSVEADRAEQKRR
jgi:sec-independent protein translocase protein TatA